METITKNERLAFLADLNLHCIAISACDAFDSLDLDVKFRKLGDRAYNLYEVAETVITDRAIALSDKYKGDVDQIKADPENAVLVTALSRLPSNKVDFEFDVIEMPKTKPDGTKFSFPETKKIDLRGQTYEVNPYSEFLDLIAKGYVKLND